ncbi:MAG: polyhydroxyalkanoic acid system family protein [Patescibacteria group bacterium]|nr:polyhydroxyalkanoic acid system family protein [Patescibacteria group bacterium]
MPRINETLSHSLSLNEAKKRITQLIPRLKEAHGDQISEVSEYWQENTNSFSFQIMGFNISGSIRVMDSTVEITGKLPFTAGLFKGKIINAIHTEGTKLLS